MILDKNDIPCKKIEIEFDYCPKCGEQIKVVKLDNTQQLKAKISNVLSHAKSYQMFTGETGYQLTKNQYEELLKLSAVVEKD